MQPKKGRAVLWPATFNERPFEKDARTHHEALPVLKGIKYAALLSPPRFENDIEESRCHWSST